MQMHPFPARQMGTRLTTRAALAVVSFLAVGAPILMAAAPAQAQGVTLEMSATPTTLPTGSTSTLNVTASSDLRFTPWYVRIYDTTSGMTLLNPGLNCGTGTTCSVSVTQSISTTHTYRARLEDASGKVDPGSDSNTSYVTWTNTGWQVFLSAGPGGSSSTATLKAVSNRDVGPTPYWISIYKEDGPNHTAGTLLARCGLGSSCQVVVAPGCTLTHYVAFVQSLPFSLPGIQASSNVMGVSLGCGTRVPSVAPTSSLSPPPLKG